MWLYPSFGAFNFIFTSRELCNVPSAQCEIRSTHLSLHLLRKIPLRSGCSFLQGPLSVRAGVTKESHKEIVYMIKASENRREADMDTKMC